MTTRKLSNTEAAELGRAVAWRILATFEEQRIVPAFVDAYVRKHDRRELKNSQMRNRELLVMLTRESLVAIAASIQAELPRRLTPKGRDARKSQSAAAAEAADSFLHAFSEAIAASLRWTPGDVAEFAADVALYGRMAAFAERSATAAAPAPGLHATRATGARLANARAASARSGASMKSASLHLRSRAMERPPGPFADRCAMLLDPSLMEKARAAASELHSELEKIASRVLANAFQAK